MGEDELEAIRRRRLAELQAARAQQAGGVDAAQHAAAEARARDEQEAQREAILRQILMPDARERLGRIRMSRPEDARAVENQLIQLAQSGRLQSQLSDEQLKQVLARLLPNQRDISIRRK